jgi:pullulanase/glycogen debranching enzyme
LEDLVSHLLQRKETHFVLWRPAVTDPAPQLIIGVLAPGNPPELHEKQEVDLAPSPIAPELWEIKATDLGLRDRQVYHYWFRVRDSFPGQERDKRIDVTDLFAITVDWRLQASALPPPYSNDDRDPAGVVLFQNSKLIAVDPGKEQPDWTGDARLDSLPVNNRLVMYELPTRWTLNASEAGVEASAGTFRDVLALVEPAETGANFEGLEVLGPGRSYLRELGVNALELLPPADSFVGREWGYATSNYLAADYDLGFPEGNASPTATTDLAVLVRSCHQAGIRFFIDVVMAFATRASQENINYLDFHVQRGTGDPEEDDRVDFGGKLMKYNFRINGYDPISGNSVEIVPSRQWMKTFLWHWMMFYRIDGVRMDSVVNFNNWDFMQEFKDLGRELWRERWRAQNSSLAGAEERYLVVGEELAVPLDLIYQNRLDGLWNEIFKRLVRQVILGGPGMSDRDFPRLVEEMIDCRRLGFRDGAQAVNYVTSHDVEGFRNERLYNFLDNNGVAFKEKQIKLAFVCLMTAVGIPMIFAGEEFADEHDLPIRHPEKQTDPVNFRRLEDDWRRRIFEYVGRLAHFRTSSAALSVNDTRFLHYDFTPGRRIMAWERGSSGSADRVVVVANFSEWGTENPESPSAEYRVANWPPLPAGRRWREITQARDVPVEWAGREPLFPWEAKVYVMVPNA